MRKVLIAFILGIFWGLLVGMIFEGKPHDVGFWLMLVIGAALCGLVPSGIDKRKIRGFRL